MGAGEKASSVGDGFTLSKMDPKSINNLARQFAMQYYTVMRKYPAGLHRFYKDDSAVIYEDTTIFGQKFIHEHFMSINIHDVRIGILCLDALRSGQNSVLIQVSGEMSREGSDFRRFTQSFILSEQAPYDFYVVNDIFKYQDLVYGDVNPESQDVECNGLSSPHSFGEGAVKRVVASQNAEVSMRGKTDGQQLCENQLESTINVSTWKSQAYGEAPSQQPETVLEERTLNEPDENTTLSEPVNTVTPSPISQESSMSSALESPVAPVPLSQPRSWAEMASQQVSKPTGRAYAQPYQNRDDKPQPNNVLSVQGQVNAKTRVNGQRQQTGLDNRSAGAGDHGHSQDATLPGKPLPPRQGGPARIGSGGRGFSRGGRSSGVRGGGGGAIASGARMPNAVPTAAFGPRRS